MDKRQLQKQERRARIIEVAKMQFIEHGISAVQLQDIARAAEIGIATLYRHFPSKEQLVIAVNNTITAQMLAEIERIRQQQLTAYEKVERILDYYISLVDDPAYRLVNFMRTFEQPAEPQVDREEYVQLRLQLAEQLLLVGRQGVADGSLRADIDLDVYMLTAVQNISQFTAETAYVQHDPLLPVTLQTADQLAMLKHIFLQYVRPFR